MRTIIAFSLALILSISTALAQNTQQETAQSIDAKATAQAPWKVNDVVYENENMVRKFLGITEQGHYLVQQFFKSNGNKQSDPYTIIDAKAATSDKTSYFIDGKYAYYREDGSKSLEGTQANGKRIGTHTFWYDGKQKSSETQFNNDGEITQATDWYLNGQKQLEVNYSADKSYGTLWYENGQKQTEGNLKNDEQEGLWTEWDESGKKVAEAWYENGQEVKRETF